MKTKPNWDKDTTLVNMLPALLDMCKCFQYHHCYKGCQIGVAAPQPGAPPTSSASQPPVLSIHSYCGIKCIDQGNSYIYRRRR